MVVLICLFAETSELKHIFLVAIVAEKKEKKEKSFVTCLYHGP